MVYRTEISSVCTEERYIKRYVASNNSREAIKKTTNASFGINLFDRGQESNRV